MEEKVIESGKFLLSEPFMADPHFKRSVVLLCEHDKEGSVGFIVNKPLDTKIEDVMPIFDNLDLPCHYGGPVGVDSLHFLHRLSDLDGAKEVVPGLFWGGNFEALRLLVQSGQVTDEDIKFYLGYSGWSPGQLETEMEKNSWILAEAGMSDLFNSDMGSLWKDILTKLGGEYKMMSNFPEDPSLN